MTIWLLIKFFFMETEIICQEILIVYRSRFFSRELSQREEESDGRHLTKIEHLAEACWNGLIKDALPEISTDLSLTEISEGHKILDLRYSDTGETVEKAFSVNPYLFLDGIRSN